MRRLTGTSRQFRIEKWFWAATIPPNVVVTIMFPDFWAKWGLLYVAFQSAYALVKGAGGQEQAAEAKEAARESVRAESQVQEPA